MVQPRMKKVICSNGQKQVRMIFFVTIRCYLAHTKNLELFEIARENGVILVSITPQIFHKLPPLVLGFMAPYLMHNR